MTDTYQTKIASQSVTSVWIQFFILQIAWIFRPNFRSEKIFFHHSYVCLFGISDESSKSRARFGSDLPLSFFGKSLSKSSSWSGFMWDAFKQHCTLDKNHYFLTENISLCENILHTFFYVVFFVSWCLFKTDTIHRPELSAFQFSIRDPWQATFLF